MSRLKSLGYKAFSFNFILIGMVGCALFSCSTEEADTVQDPNAIEDPIPPASCTEVANYIFIEKDGLVQVQFEEAVFDPKWKMNTDGDDKSGKGYMVWTGEQSLSQPGLGATSFNIRIQNTGVYRFMWKSAVKMGNSGTDHNDTWLRFADASDFFGQKGESIVYPKGTGKTPNPEGATGEGWFKIYRSGNDLDFKWQATTFDNNGHDVFVQFDDPGIYEMEISARSSGHAIDKFVLFQDSYSKSDIEGETLEFSAIECN